MTGQELLQGLNNAVNVLGRVSVSGTENLRYLLGGISQIESIIRGLTQPQPDASAQEQTEEEE